MSQIHSVRLYKVSLVVRELTSALSPQFCYSTRLHFTFRSLANFDCIYPSHTHPTFLKKNMPADLLMKALSRELVERHRKEMGIM